MCRRDDSPETRDAALLFAHEFLELLEERCRVSPRFEGHYEGERELAFELVGFTDDAAFSDRGTGRDGLFDGSCEFVCYSW